MWWEVLTKNACHVPQEQDHQNCTHDQWGPSQRPTRIYSYTHIARSIAYPPYADQTIAIRRSVEFDDVAIVDRARESPTSHFHGNAWHRLPRGVVSLKAKIPDDDLACSRWLEPLLQT